ncbi:hypothetical protein [Natronobeatus ordinarius]|uniref:hypothetical protein n=1 Tax=Natronobeatus ordinarius TaxID=2963433 RepID=UPI0020CD3F53|nr:hypothetical protein [Natronobeatus ordinarius]
MTKFEIEINYGDEFCTAVTDGTADPYTGIRIHVDDSYLYGASDRVPKNWVTYIVNSLLESVPEIVNGKKAVITNHNGPSYFVLEPEDNTKTRITNVLQYEGIDDPDQRLPEAKSAVVETRSVIEESIRTGEELVDQIMKYNPDLTDHTDIQLLRSNLDDARTAAEGI